MANINPGEIAVIYVVFLLALCFHEYAHGFVAKLRGDDTAKLMGRLTMNPMAHIDWLGTVALPLIGMVSGMPLFGWAKPVPVNPRNLKTPKNDMFLVAIAGPASNVLLAIVGAIVYVTLAKGTIGIPLTPFMQRFWTTFIVFNLFLAVFNMIPIHPLDGGKVVGRFLPENINRFLEENQQVLVIVLMVFFIGGGFKYLAGPVYGLAELLVRIVS